MGFQYSNDVQWGNSPTQHRQPHWPQQSIRPRARYRVQAGIEATAISRADTVGLGISGGNNVKALAYFHLVLMSGTILKEGQRGGQGKASSTMERRLWQSCHTSTTPAQTLLLLTTPTSMSVKTPTVVRMVPPTLWFGIIRVRSLILVTNSKVSTA